MKKSRQQFRMIAFLGIILILFVFGAWGVDIEQDHVKTAWHQQMIVSLRALQSIQPEESQKQKWVDATIREHPDWRITWVNSDGSVRFDSEINASLLNNHANRVEVVEAIKTGIGHAIRDSESLHQSYVYVAAHLGQREVMRVGMLTATVENQPTKLRFPLALMGIMLVIFWFLLERLAFGWTRNWSMYMRTIKDWSTMHFDSRLDVLVRDPLAPMASALNHMITNVEHHMLNRSIGFARLQTIVESMQTGVVLLDEKARVVLLNDAAEQFLGFVVKESTSKRYISEVAPYEVMQWVEESIEFRKPIQQEWHAYYPEDRILLIQLIPLPMLPDGEAVLLMMIQDMTALRRLEKIRSEFVANVSHELKTPIAAIRGFSETLLAGAMNDPETSQSFLQVILDESERLNRLINGLLEISRLESKRTLIQFTRLNLIEILDSTIQVVRNEATQKQITIHVLFKETYWFEADPDRIRQVFMNLLSNAVHYTLDGGRITVDAQTQMVGLDEPHLHITVSDNGIGMHQDDLPRIFERFYRVDKARTRSSGGTGLGLSIVKHIVDLHRGNIHVESKIGRGSRFTVSLPLKQVTDTEGMK